MSDPREVARRLFGVPEDEYEDEANGVRAVTLRIDLERLAFVDAMASVAHVSRNVMLNELVSVGLSALLGQVDDETRSNIEHLVADDMNPPL